MKKRVYSRSPSQIINNFYTLVTIVMMTVVITLYSKYIYPTQKTKFTSVVLPCQTALQMKQNIPNDSLLKEALILFEEGNYMLDGGSIFEENSPLFKLVSIENINKEFENQSEVVAINNAQKFLNIKYELIETQTKSKSLVEFLVSFRISANEVFRMYTYLNVDNPKEISQKVECIMDSFKANAKQ